MSPALQGTRVCLSTVLAVAVHLTPSLKPSKRFLTCCHLLGNSGKQSMHSGLHVCAICQPSSGLLFYCVVCQRHPQGNKILAVLAASPPQQPSTSSGMVEQRAGAAQGQKKTAESAWFGCVLITATQQIVNVETWSRTLLLECCAQAVGRLFIFPAH